MMYSGRNCSNYFFLNFKKMYSKYYIIKVDKNFYINLILIIKKNCLKLIIAKVNNGVKHFFIEIDKNCLKYFITKIYFKQKFVDYCFKHFIMIDKSCLEHSIVEVDKNCLNFIFLSNLKHEVPFLKHHKSYLN